MLLNFWAVSFILEMLIVKGSYRKLKIVRHDRRAAQAQWDAPAAHRPCRQRQDSSWTVVSWSLGTSLIIWRFARLVGLLPRPTLPRMSPTNVIPHNSSGTGKMCCVVSAVSSSPWICKLVAHEVARWSNTVRLSERLRLLPPLIYLFIYLFKVTC